MNDFTSIYLSGLRAGMAKKAAGEGPDPRASQLLDNAVQLARGVQQAGGEGGRQQAGSFHPDYEALKLKYAPKNVPAVPGPTPGATGPTGPLRLQNGLSAGMSGQAATLRNGPAKLKVPTGPMTLSK
jgi:hypothetical protein